ncbi:hypothetical protein DFH07DRAFT_950037 [Mycena maculata]|uniref:Uncharacterized protein n=1 Tax=Mycena maculata TaxID=230809 RepID=A0AAD7K8V0_9AGAR|nr:hypothetical protein DFH07DRAFT_950037 [Mycena maculata]
MDPPIAPPGAKPSPHAAAQARYRARNAEAEREKARLRMRKKREQSKEQSTLPAELYTTPEFLEFREFINKVKTVELRVNRDDPAELAEFNRLIATNPCVEDLGAATNEVVAYYYCLQVRFNRYPEWQEELADYRDIVQEHTTEELDQMQLDARARLANKMIILARGGF